MKKQKFPNAPLYLITSRTSDTQGIIIRVFALKTAEKKTKIWSYQNRLGHGRQIKVESVNKVSDGVFANRDSIRRSYEAFAEPTQIDAVIAAIEKRHEEDLTAAKKAIDAITIAFAVNKGPVIQIAPASSDVVTE